MKQIIDRKIYDTQTATLIAEWTNFLPAGDCHAIEQKLYKTRRGNYFLEYWGGAGTRYANTWRGHAYESTGFIPLLEHEAYEWLEKKGHIEIILTQFKDQIEEA